VAANAFAWSGVSWPDGSGRIMVRRILASRGISASWF